MSYGAWLPAPPWADEKRGRVRYEHEDAEEIAALLHIAKMSVTMPNIDLGHPGQQRLSVWIEGGGAQIVEDIPNTLEDWREMICAIVEKKRAIET